MPVTRNQALMPFAFYNGALHIRRNDEVMRIAGWPKPEATRRHEDGGPWRTFQPEFRLVKPYRGRKTPPKKKPDGEEQFVFDFFPDTFSRPPAERDSLSRQRTRAFDSFRFSLPRPVARALEPFRTHQWPLLVLLRYDEAGVELAESNPALAFFLAQHLKADRELIESLQCGKLRQRELLEILDFEGSKKAVNLFRKIAPASITGDNWSAMVDLLREQAREPKSALNHLPSINAGVMEIMLDRRACHAATPTLLEEVARDRSENYRGRIIHMITSTLSMQEELRCGRHWERFPSIERLRDVHEQVSENYRRRIRQLIDVNAQQSDYFRNPPMPGIPGKIEPITSPESLVDEGEEQGNCVASYASRVREGHTFIYRVLEPERATLSIVRKSLGGEWEIGELETRFNTPASDETEALVQAWLERHRLTV